MSGLRYPIEMIRGVPVVAAPEEIDNSTADWFEAVLLQARCCGHGTFVVDMTGTRFCNAAGLEVLTQAHERALAQGGELRLVTPASALVLRMLTCSGLDQLIPNFAGLDEALQPEPAAPASPRLPDPVPESARPD